MARPVTEFVKGGPVPINRRVEILRMRHRDEIVARAVIGRCAADADFGPGGCNQLGCLRKDQAFGHGRRGNMIFVGQAIALVDRKNSELLQERKAALAFARPAAAGLGRVGCRAPGIDDPDPALAAADTAPQRERLTKSQETMAPKAPAHNRMPEGEDVDAAVAPVAHHIIGETGRGPARIPRLNPGQPPGFELGDDPAGDLFVEGRARAALARWFDRTRHIGSPRRTGGEPLSPRPIRPGVRAPLGLACGGIAAARPTHADAARPCIARSLAKMFFLCSLCGMDKIDTARVAETILAAPGWARVGITAPTSHIRVEAAFELARAIVESVRAGAEPASPDQLGLSL